MLTLDFYNPTGKAPTRVLLGLLRLAFQHRYSVCCFIARDTIATRRERTRGGVVEVELFGDASGLEVAAFGWRLLVGVEARGSDLVRSLP